MVILPLRVIAEIISTPVTEVEVSPTFLNVPKERLYQFLAEARQDEIGAEIAFLENG